MKIKKRRRGKIQGQPRKMAVAIGTGFGAGYWPWGAGTAGALLATLIWTLFVKHVEGIEMLLVGVRPDYQNTGINSIVFSDILGAYIKNKGNF